MFEEFLHLLLSLTTLDCSFVGLELPKPIGSEKKLMLDCCDECTKAGRTRYIYMYVTPSSFIMIEPSVVDFISRFKGAWHDFVKSAKYAKPDLTIASQSGYVDEAVEDWTPMIKYN